MCSVISCAVGYVRSPTPFFCLFGFLVAVFPVLLESNEKCLKMPGCTSSVRWLNETHRWRAVQPAGRMDGRGEADVFALIDQNSIHFGSTCKRLPQIPWLIWQCLKACITGGAVTSTQHNFTLFVSYLNNRVSYK